MVDRAADVFELVAQPCEPVALPGAEEVRFGDGGELRRRTRRAAAATSAGHRGVRGRHARTLEPSRASRTTDAKTPILLLHQAAFDERSRGDPPHLAASMPSHIHSAASRAKPVRNTASRSRRSRSGSLSSWALQSMVARSVRWRSGRSRAPPTRSGSARSSRSERAAGVSTRSRAAASSSASGHVVQCRDDGGDIGCVGVSEIELRFHRAGSLDEKLDGDRGRQRCQREGLFPVDAKRDSARRKHRNGAPAEERAEFRRRVDDLLHIVQDSSTRRRSSARVTFASSGSSPVSRTPSAVAIAGNNKIRVLESARGRRTRSRRETTAQHPGRRLSRRDSCRYHRDR